MAALFGKPTRAKDKRYFQDLKSHAGRGRRGIFGDKIEKKICISLRKAKTGRRKRTMELVKRQLADLKPAEYNPRKALKPGDPDTSA